MTAQTPDFVIVGGQSEDGRVMLMASRTLDHVELSSVYDIPDPLYRHYHNLTPPPPRPTHTITAVTHEYIVVSGADYREAWQTLFDQWAPPPPGGRRELQHRKGIEQ